MEETAPINLEIRIKIKARLDNFQEWLNTYCTHDIRYRWTQSEALEEIIAHKWTWREYLKLRK